MKTQLDPSVFGERGLAAVDAAILRAREDARDDTQVQARAAKELREKTGVSLRELAPIVRQCMETLDADNNTPPVIPASEGVIELMRQESPFGFHAHAYICAAGAIRGVLSISSTSDTEKLAQIRGVMAALDQRLEMDVAVLDVRNSGRMSAFESGSDLSAQNTEAGTR